MNATRLATAAVTSALLTLAGGGCPPQPTPPPAAALTVNVAPTLFARLVVSGANQPRGIAFTPDGRLLYGEKDTGLIRMVVNGQLLAAPFAALPVNFAGDRGLLSLAVHPDFETNQRVYVCYSRSDTGASTNDPNGIVDNRVVYFEAAGNQAAGGEVFVASLPIGTSTERVGGRIAIDGSFFLWVALGDQFTPGSAQDASSLAGKVLRYNDDGSIPGDNPDGSSPVVALGLRHPRGLSIDPVTGSPFVLDANEGGFHEVNRVQLDRNLGWPAVIGFAVAPNELGFAAAVPNYTDPLFETLAGITDVGGGAFDPGSQYGPRRQNQFFFGGGSQQLVYVAELNGSRTAAEGAQFGGPFQQPVTDIGFSPSGTLYVGTTNAIYRVVPRAWDS